MCKSNSTQLQFNHKIIFISTIQLDRHLDHPKLEAKHAQTWHKAEVEARLRALNRSLRKDKFSNWIKMTLSI